MSAGEAVGTTVFEWARDALGVTINEMFGQTEMNYIVGNSHALWPAKPGSMGRPYPGHRIAVIDDDGQRSCRAGEPGDVAVQPHRARRHARPGVLPRVLRATPRRTREQVHRRLVPHRRRRERATPTATSGTRAAPTTCSRRRAIASGRPRSRTASCKHPAVANAAVVPSPDETRGNVVKAFIVLAPGHAPSHALEDDIQQHVRSFLAPYEYPKEIEFIDALPMTTTGKVQRKVLREREAARKAHEA